MKEIYYGRIPLGVPLQKRPWKYQSNTYPYGVDDGGIVGVVKVDEIILFNPNIFYTHIKAEIYKTSSVKLETISLLNVNWSNNFDDGIFRAEPNKYLGGVSLGEITLKDSNISFRVYDSKEGYITGVKVAEISIFNPNIYFSDGNNDNKYLGAVALNEILFTA